MCSAKRCGKFGETWNPGKVEPKIPYGKQTDKVDFQDKRLEKKVLKYMACPVHTVEQTRGKERRGNRAGG